MVQVKRGGRDNMGVAIALRRDEKLSFFKETLLELLKNTDADELILSSGYMQFIQNDPKIGTYKFLNDQNKDGDTLIDLICDKCKEVTFIGVMGWHNKNKMRSTNSTTVEWYDQYRATYDYLKSEVIKRQANVKLNFYYRKYNEWHAKIALFMKKDSPNNPIPIAAIVGSSNLTRSAMGDDSTPQSMMVLPSRSKKAGYNMEADTLIYTNNVQTVVNQCLVQFDDMEQGEILSFTTMPTCYGQNNISSEADVILAEYKEIMQELKIGHPKHYEIFK